MYTVEVYNSTSGEIDYIVVDDLDEVPYWYTIIEYWENC